MTNNPLKFIEHILENINNIENFSANLTKDELLKDKLKQYAIIRAIEIIGEAAKNLPQQFRNSHPDVDWKEIIGTRDRIIHHYFGVDLDIVWNIVKKDLPKLKEKINKILSEVN
ncbi:MAG: DUF86 domain-containing protein [Nanoarchaeota archaeon]